MKSSASRGWKVVQIVITVHSYCRTKEMKGWKKPFKKLKFSEVRAEQEWGILLDVNVKEQEKIQALLDGKFQIETIMEPDMENEVWEGKTGAPGQNIDTKI